MFHSHGIGILFALFILCAVHSAPLKQAALHRCNSECTALYDQCPDTSTACLEKKTRCLENCQEYEELDSQRTEDVEDPQAPLGTAEPEMENSAEPESEEEKFIASFFQGLRGEPQTDDINSKFDGNSETVTRGGGAFSLLNNYGRPF